jgi:predicted dehydrogenase
MNQTVGWGILGTARIATKVGAAINAAEHSTLQAIGSRNANRAAEWANEHGALRSYDSYEAVLDDPQVDAVYIPLPPAMHHEWTLKAAARGKHVLSEKPLAATVADAEEMAAACQEHRVQLMDGVMWLHHPRAADMKQLLGSGQLGKLRRLTSAFSFHWDEIPTGDLRLQRELGGGSLLDLGWYCVGGALWAFDRMPVRVVGHATWHHDVDMNFCGTMWYDDGAVASFDTAFDTVMRRWIEVAGTQASLVCDDFTRPYQEDKVRCWIHHSDGTSAEHKSDAPNQETCMVEDFNRLVQAGEIDPHWPTISVQTQRICDALDRSARTGLPVELN